MTIKFFGDRTIQVENERGKRIQQMLKEGVEWIEIDGEIFNPKSISAIEDGPEPGDRVYIPGEVSDAHKERFMLETAVKTCKGDNSITIAIMAEAKKVNPANRIKILKDKDWREVVREQLWEQRQDWCDAERGTCFCRGMK